MAPILYNNIGEFKPRAGQLINSEDGYTIRNGYNPRPALLSAVSNPAGWGGGASAPFSIVSNDGFYNYSGTVNLTLSAESYHQQLINQIGYPFRVDFQSPTAFLFNSVLNGVGFVLTVNSTVFLNLASVAGTTLEAGRFVIPVADTAIVGQNDYNHQQYRYPTLGEATAHLNAGIILLYDGHTNQYQSVNQLLYTEWGRCLPGTALTGISRGAVVIDTPSALGLASTLHVNTTAAGAALAGRITSVASASTIPLPLGKISPLETVLSATGGLTKIRVNY